ncbi:conserved hypothetical protein [Ricinus communis]|uniref:Uncharacterized protein n=1 Tax=Ricinus communis TaxID=3988 RepID=B9SVL8_RICCO|nr:conserved hypothetical protein [Ricinus communis]
MSIKNSEHVSKNHHHNRHHQAQQQYHYCWLVSDDRPTMRKNQAAEDSRKPIHVRVGHQDIYSDSVDDATEAFIKLEHKMFEN